MVKAEDKLLREKRMKAATKEANILARLNHKNIVRVLGTAIMEENCFVIVLEYVPCGNLENFLLADKMNLAIPWKIRLKFFAELANALNYLHYHDPTQSYIHGDIKPQNVLLGDTLNTKLADFGAISITKTEDTTSSKYTKEKANTQHTLEYTAPEFLKNSTIPRLCSIDVYSYGMIGYEITTKTKVYSGPNQVSPDILQSLITSIGLKPDTSRTYEVGKLLKIPNEISIFQKLKDIVYDCWKTKAKDRPSISDVKQSLHQLTEKEQIYNKTIDAEARRLIKKRNLKPPLPEVKTATKFVAIKRILQRHEHGQLLLNYSVIVTIIIVVILSALIATYQTQIMSSSCSFLAVNSEGISKFDLTSDNGNITTLLHFPKPLHPLDNVPYIIPVNDVVYVISSDVKVEIMLRVNLSKTPLTWENLDWEIMHKNRKYIAFKDSILAIGRPYSSYRYMGFAGNYVRSGCPFTDLFNTTTGTWIQLQDMNERRIGHTLVLFQGMVCAVGGGNYHSAECFTEAAINGITCLQ